MRISDTVRFERLLSKTARRIVLWALSFSLFLFLINSHASAQESTPPPSDASGCEDSSLIPRLTGSFIRSCEKVDNGHASMPMQFDGDTTPREHIMDGEYSSWDYAIPEDTQQENAFEKISALVESSGFIVKYRAAPNTLTGRNGNKWVLIEVSGTYYRQTILVEKVQQLVIVDDASVMLRELNAKGHVALYGIQFEGERREQLESPAGKTLLELLRLLKQNADVKLLIESHANNQGDPEIDKVITQHQADAIVQWLVSRGIASARLRAVGYGQSRPVAQNDTPEERAENQRIEIVKE